MTNHKKFGWLLICVFATLFSMAACSGGTNRGNDINSSMALSAISIDVQGVVVDPSKTSLNAITRAVLPPEVTTVRVTISGFSIPDPIIYDLVKNKGNWKGIIGNVPAGNSLVLVQAFDVNGTRSYENTASVAVNNNAIVQVNMLLQSVVTPAQFNVKAPVIQRVDVSPRFVAPREPVQLKVVAVDPDPGGDLTYIWTPDDKGSYNDRTSSAPIWTPPSEPGIYQLGVTVIDREFLIATSTVTIEVNEIYGDGTIKITVGTNNYPEIYSILSDPTSMDRNGSANLTIDAVDPDGDTLSFEWRTNCDGSFDDSKSQSPVFTASENAEYGACEIESLVSDGTLTAKGSITIHISSGPYVNFAPTIVSMFQSADKVSPLGKITFIVKAKGSSVPLTFAWTTSAGVFGATTVNVVGDQYEGSVDLTAPSGGSGPINVQVKVMDSAGLFVSDEFLPITLE